MDSYPISNFLTNIKILMTLEQNPHILFISDLDVNTKETIEQVPYNCCDSEACLDKLIHLYLNKLRETETYKQIVMFIHNEELVIEKISRDLKAKLYEFKYLMILNKQQQKNQKTRIEKTL